GLRPDARTRAGEGASTPAPDRAHFLQHGKHRFRLGNGKPRREKFRGRGELETHRFLRQNGERKTQNYGAATGRKNAFRAQSLASRIRLVSGGTGFVRFE